MKSAGNFLLLRLTAWLKTLVVTPYILANSISKTTFCPRIVRITGSSACELYLASFSVIGHPFPLRWVFHPGSGRFFHPTEDRTITIREAARLHSYPDTFHFLGTYTEMASQIGESVPPLLAKTIAECII